MFRRRESVPFSFVAEADRFRSNVTPPPRERAGLPELASRTLVGLAVVASLVGSLLLGVPALGTDQAPSHDHKSQSKSQSQKSEAARGH